MPSVHCPACGKEIPDAASACPHCGRPAGQQGADAPRSPTSLPAGSTGRRRGIPVWRSIPVWGKLLVVLAWAAVPFVLFAANKRSEAELRQAIRDKGKELQAK